MRKKGFPPLAKSGARVLVLGSLPGQRSLDAVEYYAHPQNAFWKIMHDLFGISGSYAERCRQLGEQDIALWDVLAESVRPGSMDADIDLSSAQTNDFSGFLDANRTIRKICFNGAKAESIFRKRVAPSLECRDIEYLRLPSTSPAYASMTYDDKLRHWRNAIGGQ